MFTRLCVYAVHSIVYSVVCICSALYGLLVVCICSVLYCADAEVILESPAHPVTEGDPLTLHCRYRKKPSNEEADIYKDGSPLQPTVTGEVTIPAVSKVHEGRYRCKHSERGESAESWVTVRDRGEQGGPSGRGLIL